MSTKKKKVTVGYRYFMGLHFALCHGPIDKFRKITAGERDAWAGSETDNTTITVSAPSLFGGDEREGGIDGTAELYFGGPSQTVSSTLSDLLGGLVPGFRGVFSLFYNGQISANNPYIKPFAFKVERILEGWDGDTWYPEKAQISIGSSDAFGYTADWEYQVLPEESNPGFDNISVPTSGWLAATAGPFGGGLASGQTPPGNTLWPLRTVLWVRKTVTLGAGITGQIEATAENGCLIFANGELIGDVNRENDDPPTIPPTEYFNVPRSSPSTSENITIAIKAFDETISETGTTTYLRTALVLSGFSLSMNPAHIIYQCLTDRRWGMGYPTSAIDDASFTDAADVLFDEGLGLCLLWNRTGTIEGFIQEIANHAGAIVGQSQTTGKFTIKLLRYDYTPASLPVFDESNIVEVKSFQRPGYGETVNEITVVYRDIDTNKDASITVQDLANVQAQGATVTETRQYPGLPSADLAARIAERDLRASSTPLAKATIVCDRSAWLYASGDVVKLTWAKLGLSEVIMRILSIDYGTLTDGKITIDLVEDVFGLSDSSYVTPQDPGFVEQDTGPVAITVQTALEVPYWSLVQELGEAEASSLDPDASYLGVFASKPSDFSLQFNLYTRVGSGDFDQNGVGDFVPVTTLAIDIDQQEVEIVLTSGYDTTAIAVDDLAQIGEGNTAEWVQVTAITSDGVMVNRAVLDTTPTAWPAGTYIYFGDGREAYDTTERVTGQTVDFKLQTLATGGVLDLADATVVSETADQRHYRPYPPGNILVNGEAFPLLIDGALTITWSHRDRLQQTAYVVEQTEGDIGPEANTVYNGYAFDDDTDTLLDLETGITGTSWSPSVSGTYNLRIEIESERDDGTSNPLASWQRQIRTFIYSGLTTEDGDARLTEEGAPRSEE